MSDSSSPPSYETAAYDSMEHGRGSDNSVSNEDSAGQERTMGQKVLRALRKNLLVILLIIALLLGIALGAGLRFVDPPLDVREQMYLRFPGEILMNMLQLLILPLIVSSLISGMTSLDSRASGKLGARAVLYYLTTTLLAVITGIILVLTIRPGERGDAPDKGAEEFKKVEAADTFLDLIRQMFPDNLVEATFRKKLTQLKMTKNITATNGTDVLNQTIEYVPELERTYGINMLGLVVFSIALGIAINKLGSKGKVLKEFVESLCEATLLLVTAVIWYSPIGVLFLVAAQVVSMDDPMKTFEQIGFYFLTVMAGLGVHGFIVLPLIYFILVRKNPYKFILGVIQALMTALGTSSSSATLPVTMKNLEENNGVDPRITSFVAPVGATINMDGTALYEAVAVIFIGQVKNHDMGIDKVITICLTSTAAAIGAAGVPQAGLVTMVIVLTAVGFPTDDIGMIMAIDWLLDRFRTMVNVLGDAIGAGIVNHYSKADLKRMDEEDRMIHEERENRGENSLKEIMDGEQLSKKAAANGGLDNVGFDNSRL